MSVVRSLSVLGTGDIGNLGVAGFLMVLLFVLLLLRLLVRE